MARCLRVLPALLAALSPMWSGCGGRLEDVARMRQCRANMNTLATEQALYRATYGCWADSVDLLDGLAGRTEPLLCPSCSKGYEMSVDESGYTVECPSENPHGAVVNGTPSWSEERPVSRGGSS